MTCHLTGRADNEWWASGKKRVMGFRKLRQPNSCCEAKAPWGAGADHEGQIEGHLIMRIIALIITL